MNSSAAAPNFGGFLSSVFYGDEPENACVIDPSNCGVGILVTGDFFKDGKTDVVTLEYDGTLNVLRNDGSGGFQAPKSYASAAAATGFFFIGAAYASDLNNDGYPDIVALDLSNNQFLNNGDGTFADPVAMPSLAAGSLGAIAIGDVNHDGNADVVAISYNAIDYTQSTITVQTFLGNGDGTFAAPTAALTETAAAPSFVEVESQGITLADLNHDGSLDLVSVIDNYFSPNIGEITATVALGNNSGAFPSFSTATPVLTVPASNPFQLYLNNDGKIDLVFSAEFGIFTALGKGDGTFQPAVSAVNNGVDGSFQLAFADVNGDGYIDLINCGYFTGILPGNGDGTFSAASADYLTDGGGGNSFAFVDVNNDGIPDFIQAEGDYRKVSVMTGRGDGTYSGAPVITDPANGVDAGNLILQTAADVTGDGNTDLIETNQPYGEVAHLVTGVGSGNGKFSFVSALSDTDYGGAFVQPATADFDGDGKQDIVLTGARGYLAVALSNGDGTFKTPVPITLGSLDCPLNYVGTGNIQHNGKQGLIAAYGGDPGCGGPDGAASGYYVIVGNGDGTFAAPKFNALGGELSAHPPRLRKATSSAR